MTELSDSFYVTLSSSADSDFHPENTVAHFKNKTATPLDLTSNKWEVALVEISCPFNFHNVSKSDVYIAVLPWPKVSTTHEVKIYMNQGHYGDAKTFIKELNNRILDSGVNTIIKNLKFYYDDISQRVRIRNRGGMIVTLSPKLQRMLGIASKHEYIRDHLTAEHVIDITDSLHHMYVYTNLIEHRSLGRQMVPLVRIIPINGTGGNMNDIHNFHNLHYFKVKRCIFDTIEVDIRSGVGEYIPFNRGVCILTFHFKKIQ